MLYHGSLSAVKPGQVLFEHVLLRLVKHKGKVQTIEKAALSLLVLPQLQCSSSHDYLCTSMTTVSSHCGFHFCFFSLYLVTQSVSPIIVTAALYIFVLQPGQSARANGKKV